MIRYQNSYRSVMREGVEGVYNKDELDSGR